MQLVTGEPAILVSSISTYPTFRLPVYLANWITVIPFARYPARPLLWDNIAYVVVATLSSCFAVNIQDDILTKITNIG